MPEEVLFESERRTKRAEIASYFRTVADKLAAGDPITFEAGGEPLTLTPPDQPTFEVKVEREGAAGGPKETSIEFELEWGDGDGGSDGELSIE